MSGAEIGDKWVKNRHSQVRWGGGEWAWQNMVDWDLEATERG